MLYAMHGPSCAYCQDLLTRGDRGDVEHFRPKKNVTENPQHGGYWWLAYRFDNYLLSCIPCNRTLKRSHFPVADNGHITYAGRADLSGEKRLLLDPCRDKVEDLMILDPHDRLCRVMPAPRIRGLNRQRVETTIDIFRLNKDDRLYKSRRNTVREVLKALAAGQDEQVRRSAGRYQAGSWVVRQVLTALNRSDLLPDAEEELVWFLESLREDIDSTLIRLDTYPADKALKRRLRELQWSLVTLWRAPPTGDPKPVTLFLEQHRLLHAVKALSSA